MNATRAEQELNQTQGSIPYQIVIGLLLVAVWWSIAWLQLQPVSNHYFFPLWLGYIVTVDGIVAYRTGTSPSRRSLGTFILLFLLSAPFWWIFEGLNEFLQNWHYVLPGDISTVEYVLSSTLSFSTLIPAVIVTIELFASFRIGERIPGLGHWRFGARGLLALQIAGIAILVLIALWPTYTFPLVWLALFFVIEPINQRVGQPSLWNHVRENQWGPVYTVWLATTFTGFFWEMWNIYALPKWEYDVPFVHVLQVFEMPVLGYFGYMPFGMEVIAFTALFLWLLGHRPQRFIRTAYSDKPSN